MTLFSTYVGRLSSQLKTLLTSFKSLRPYFL